MVRPGPRLDGLRGLGPVPEKPRADGHALRLHSRHALHGAAGAPHLRARRQGAAAGHPRAVHRAALEAGCRQHHPLRRRRRHRHHPGRCRHGHVRPAHADRSGRRIRRRVRLRSLRLPGAVHAPDHGRKLLGQCPPDVPARAHEHERDDGRHGAGDELPHDGARHAAGQHTVSPSEHGSHGGAGHHGMASEATIPQLVAVGSVTGLMLLVGLIVPGFYVNLSLSAADVGGAIMPRGMTMHFDTPAAAMREMAAILPRHIAYHAPRDARGDQPVEPRLDRGVKVFDLAAAVVRWHILDDVYVDAYTFNRQLPGPRLRLVQGDRVRINFRNALPESTTVHWHGLVVPNEMDGPANITQPPVPPGGTYVYEYTVEQAGRVFFHTHHHAARHPARRLDRAASHAPRGRRDAT